MTTNHTYQHTVRELMTQQGISITALAKRAGVAYNTAKRAADGDIFASNASTAEAIAQALGVGTGNIRWHKTPSNHGKPVGTAQVAARTAKAKVCPRCHTEVPIGTGVCDDHGLAGQ